MSPVTASGPEPEKAEVSESDGEEVNDDILIEEDVEDGQVGTENE
jgi:hypothetical protein